jgi:hypothetical protein
MAYLQIAYGGDDLQIWRVAANTLNKQSRTSGKGCFSNLGLGQGVNNPFPKNLTFYKMLHRGSNLDRFFRMTKTTQTEHHVWNLECQEPL